MEHQGTAAKFVGDAAMAIRRPLSRNDVTGLARISHRCGAVRSLLRAGVWSAGWPARVPDRRGAVGRLDDDLLGCGIVESRSQAAAALRNRAWASAHSFCHGQPDAMANFTRLTETRTSAPSLSSLSRIVPQAASANWVCGSPMRRSAHMST